MAIRYTRILEETVWNKGQPVPPRGATLGLWGRVVLAEQRWLLEGLKPPAGKGQSSSVTAQPPGAKSHHKTWPMILLFKKQ